MEITLEGSSLQVKRVKHRNSWRNKCWKCQRTLTKGSYRYDWRFRGEGFWQYSNCISCFNKDLKLYIVDCAKMLQVEFESKINIRNL